MQLWWLVYCFSVITVRKKPCTIAAGIQATAASNVSRDIGIENINASVDGNVT